jgi:hypothetical protein
METNNDNKRALEEMFYKVNDPDTSEDELIGILADILLEAFMWQHGHRNDPIQEIVPPETKKKRKPKNPEDQEYFYV